MKRSIRLFGLGLAVLAVSAQAADGPTLRTTELGRGMTYVIVPSMGNSRMQWMPTARKLIGQNKVVLVDLPGHGDSPMPDPFSLEAAAELVAQTIAKQKAESTIVVGHGMGGYLAVVAASAHPAYQRGVVLIDAALKMETPIPDQDQRYFLQWMDENYDAFLKMVYARMGSDSAQGVALHAQASQVPPANMKAYFRHLLNADASKQLKELKVPILFVGTERVWKSDKDWAAVSKTLGLDAAPGLANHRLAGTGALVMGEKPDSLAALLTGFRGRVVSSK